jgi:hypothetical protein
MRKTEGTPCNFFLPALFLSIVYSLAIALSKCTILWPNPCFHHHWHFLISLCCSPLLHSLGHYTTLVSPWQILYMPFAYFPHIHLDISPNLIQSIKQSIFDTILIKLKSHLKRRYAGSNTSLSDWTHARRAMHPHRSMVKKWAALSRGFNLRHLEKAPFFVDLIFF